MIEYEFVSAETISITDVHDLSTDQRYLFEMHTAITSGVCPNDLALRNPGKRLIRGG